MDSFTTSLSLLLLVLVACNAQLSPLTNPFMGTVMTYYPTTTFTNGSVTVNIRYKLNFQLCTEMQWQCLTGDCGNESLVVSTVMINSADSWCQTEGISTRQVPSNAPFQLWFNGGDWISNADAIVSSKAVTLVELRTRSDTGKANTSPQSTILPILRDPSCGRVYSLLNFDPDGDDVKCRPGNASLSECDSCRLNISLFSDTCTFSILKLGVIEGSQRHAVQLVMEDFPKETITLNQSNGAQTTLTTSDAISKIPVQFIFQVDPPAPSCTEGLYLPKFLPPTPTHGAQLFTAVNQILQIDITAQANVSTVSGVVVSGPNNMIQSPSGPGQFTLIWIPSQSEDGESHPICFVVEASLNSDLYQSALRCVIVTVGNDPNTNAPPSTSPSPTATPPDTDNTSTTTETPSPLVNATFPSTNSTTLNTVNINTSPPSPTSMATSQMTLSATYIVGLGVKISSLTPLSDIASVIQQVKDRLVSLGLPQGITMRNVSAVQHLTPPGS